MQRLRKLLTKIRIFWLVALASCAQAQAAPITGSKTDTLVYFPLSSAPTCPSGRACSYALSADSQLYDVDAAGLVLKSHAAKSYRTSANCSALASPANGDVCYDTGSSVFRYYSAGWTSGPTNDALLVHKAGTETITGAKTFTASATLTGGATLGANLAAGGFKVTSLGAPSASSDAATKGYVDALRLYHFHAHADTAAGTVYLGPAATGAASATQISLFLAPEALTVRKVACTFGTAPGGIIVDTVTVISQPSGGAWGALSTACTVTGSATTCSGSSTSSLAQYDRVGVQIARDASSVSADYDCEVWVTQ